MIFFVGGGVTAGVPNGGGGEGVAGDGVEEADEEPRHVGRDDPQVLPPPPPPSSPPRGGGDEPLCLREGREGAPRVACAEGLWQVGDISIPPSVHTRIP